MRQSATVDSTFRLFAEPQRVSCRSWRKWLASPTVQLVLCLALAALVRAFIIVRAHGMLDGDEAILGIQAEQIVHGRFATYFAGQSYMGAWDAYLAAPLIALFGPSAELLHTVTLLESLLLVPLMGALATRLYGDRARLPAMLLSALPPLYVAIGELRMLGGYVETLILGVALLLLATCIAERWAAGNSTWRLWAVFGLTLGLACWIDLLIIYYVLAIALWLAPLAAVRALRPPHSSSALKGIATGMGAFLMATLVGAMPAIRYAFATHGANISFGQGAFSAPVSLKLRLKVVAYFISYAGRQIVGGALPWSHRSVIGLLLITMMLVFALTALLYAVASALGGRPPSLRAGMLAPSSAPSGVRLFLQNQWSYALAPILGGCVALLFCMSSTPIPTVLNGPLDSSGRYALPLTTALTLALAALIADTPTLLNAASRLKFVLTVRNQTRMRIAAGVLALLLTAYGVGYVTANLETAMQTLYVYYLHQQFPAHNRELLTYLHDQRIHSVWTSHWIGNLIVYFSNGETQAADWVDTTLYHGPNRLPDALAQVSNADRPSFVARAGPDGLAHIPGALDKLGVRYTSAHLGEFWVITPLSRTVSPDEISLEMQQDY